MPTVKVRNLKNKEVGDLELSDAVFGARLNESLIHAAVRNFQANARAGTVGHKDPRRCFRLRQKALETKGHGPRAYRQLAIAFVERWRQRSWTAAARLVLQPAAKDEAGRITIRAIREVAGRERGRPR